MNVFLLMGIFVIVLGLGGGGFYLLFIRSAIKKESWDARVYQLGKGLQPKMKDKHGNVISEIQLRDLKPYATDVVTKTSDKNGKGVYKLERLNVSVGSIEAADVEHFGKSRLVHILIENDQATVLKVGYDETTGSKIYTPMQREKVELLTSEMNLRTNRLDKKTDILGKVLSYVAIGISFLAIVGITYISVNGSLDLAKEMSKSIKEIQKMNNDNLAASRDFLKETESMHNKMLNTQKEIYEENTKQINQIRNIYLQQINNQSIG